MNVSTQFLSPDTAYTMNLVFKHFDPDYGTHAPFKYKLDNETDYRISSVARVREDGWLMMELYEFTSSCREHNFRIQFVRPFVIPSQFCLFILEGIEFRPLKHVINL